MEIWIEKNVPHASYMSLARLFVFLWLAFARAILTVKGAAAVFTGGCPSAVAA